MLKTPLFGIQRVFAALTLTVAALNLCAWGQSTPFTNAGLPGGARVTALANGPGGIKLLGTWNGRIFRSTDGMATWVHTMDPVGVPLRAFFAPGDGSILAAAGVIIDGIVECFSMFPCPDIYAGGGILRSEDRGLTWKRVFTGTATAFAAHGGRIYAVDRGNFVASADDGKSWARVPSAGAFGLVIEARSLSWAGDTVYALGRTGSGAYVLKDRALTPLSSRRNDGWLLHDGTWLYAFAPQGTGDSLSRSRLLQKRCLGLVVLQPGPA